MAAMVIEVAQELKAVGEAMRGVLDEVKRARKEASVGGRAVDYAAFERTMAEKVAAVERGAHQATLQALDIDRPQVLIEGKLYNRAERCEATYYSLAGGVCVLRSLYRESGVRNGPAVDPVSLRAGVVGKGWLPQTARAMADLLQRGTSREAEQSGHEVGRLPYSHSAFQDVGHELGELYVTRHLDIEDALSKAEEIPDEAASISVGVDRVSVPMEEPRPRPVGRPRKDAPKRPIARNFRMAYVGTVTLHDQDGNALRTLRYGRMPQGDAHDLCDGLAGDVLELLRKRPDLKVATLTDGAPEMANLLEEQFNVETLGVPVHRLVDYWHLTEKLGCAAQVAFGEEEGPATVTRWKLQLLNASRAAQEILDELRRSGREHVRFGKDKPVHEAITYLKNNGDRMNYASARRRGLPIGSGNTEATCKSLVEQRMKRSGARWKERTGEHVLQLRALAFSDRWDAAMKLTLDPLRKAVRPAA